MKKKTPKSEKKIELSSECDFREVHPKQLEACCFYEYLRESAALRHSFAPVLRKLVSLRISPEADGMIEVNPGNERLVSMILPDSGLALPEGVNQAAISGLTLALINAGWHEAAKKHQAPRSWNTLRSEGKMEIARCVQRCLQHRSKDFKWHPPLLVQEFLPFPDYDPAELQLEKWKKDAYDSAPLDREYFFGVFRLDEFYNEGEAVEAFKAWFRERYGKARGGNPHWQAKLNDLVVMRLRKQFQRDKFKRVEYVAKFTTKGFKGCKEWWANHCSARKERRVLDDQTLGTAVPEEISKACRDALKFFQTLFPGEKPLSY